MTTPIITPGGLGRAERLAKGQPNPGDVYVVPEITAMAVAFSQDLTDFSFDKVFPAVDVMQQSGKYPALPREHFYRDVMRHRGDGAESQGSGFAINFDGSFNCDAWAAHTDIGKQVLGNVRNVQVDRYAAKLVQGWCWINRERQFQTKFFKAGVWTGLATGVNSGAVPGTSFLQWGDSSANPIKDIRAFLLLQEKRCGGRYRPNKIIFSADVWEVVHEHPNVISRLDRGQTPGGPAQASKADMAKLLEVAEVIVAKSVYTTSAEGPAVTATFDWIMPTGVLAVYVTPEPSILEASAGYQFNWQYQNGGAQGQTISKWWSQDRGAWRYEVEQAYDLIGVAPDLGLWFATPLGT